MLHNYKNFFLCVGFTILFLFLSSVSSFSQVPGTISYQGVLTDNSGSPLNGQYTMQFELYNSPTGGSALWTETQTDSVVNGIFNVFLGAANPLPDTLAFNTLYWLQITINNSNTPLPRIQLTSSPYSFNTLRIQGQLVASSSPSTGQVLKWTGTEWAPGTDETIGGSANGDISGTYPSLTVTGIQNKPVSATSPSSGQVLKWNGTNWAPGTDEVGTVSGTAGGDLAGNYPNPVVNKIQGKLVSSTSPSSGQVLKWNGSQWSPETDEIGGLTLPYNESISTSGNIFNINTSGGGTVIRGATTSGSGTNYGVYGLSSSTSGTGVFGNANSTNGNNYGVYGLSGSGSGTGVYGEASNSNGTNYGVFGRTNSSQGGYGVYGWASSTSGNTTIGVAGISSSNGGWGVYGEAGNVGIYARSTSPNGWAVYGTIPSGGSGDAGLFNGNVKITGSISQSVSTVQIDDPVDPANKILSSSAVQSPNMMNVYNGNVTTNASGVAVVQLPDYFDALNKDFRYQLTVIGQFAQAIIAKEIQNNQFTIQTNKPNVKVSWQVTGIRNDPYAVQNPVVTEQEKTTNARGYYLHPEAYGLPATRSIEYATHPQLMKQLQKTSQRVNAGKEQ